MKLNPDQIVARTLLSSLLRPTTTTVPARRLGAAVAQHEQPLTLLALREVLTLLEVDTLATRLMPEDLPELPCPALAYLSIGHVGCFVVVYKADQNAISWRHPEYGCLSTTLATFARIWSGIVLLAELDYRADAPDGNEKGWRRWLPA